MPSSVDALHFSPARLDPASQPARDTAELHIGIDRPRLGFYGVIDERLDLALIEAVAEARPEWQLVMAGPVVKIDPETLPRRPNIHWLGMQPYERLPYLVAAWDVCLMPFALNESTRFISPTKTLEYLAGEKPVVSTAVHDVLVLYGDVVRIAHGPMEFVQACEETLDEPPARRGQREVESLAVVSSSSWDRTASSMVRLLEEALERREGKGTAVGATPVRAVAG
jgi:glycosyltransferase involved in cell wall biosynthesis